jgi:hypothetical protein
VGEQHVCPEERNLASATLDSQQHAPWHGRESGLVAPPEPPGFLGDDLCCVVIDGRVRQPVSEVQRSTSRAVGDGSEDAVSVFCVSV